MNLKQPLFTLLYLGVLTTNLFFLGCKNEYENDNGAIRVVGAMKNAMWKGEIDG